MSLLAALERPALAVVRVVGLALLSGVVATVAGLVYRWYARQQMPEGLGVLVGLGAVGAWLNTATALRQFLGAGGVFPSPETALVNLTAFVLGAVTAAVGSRSGARLAADALARSGAVAFDAEVSHFVRSVGRFVTVKLPEEIDDADGHEPLDSETKAAVAGKTFRFPRGLTVAELRERLVARLRDDYGIGNVDVELDDDGTVTRFAVGGRTVGVGPTLAPGTVAVAVRADPAFGASAGDVVQVWRADAPAESSAEDRAQRAERNRDESEGDRPASGDGAERIATAELRATVDDVATLALPADDAARLDPDAEYRLVTLPTEPRADREFSARLQTADETVGQVTLAENSQLVGVPVGSLDVTVVAVRNGGVETVPADDRLLAAGDTLYVIARPDLLRKVESAASGESEAIDTI